MGFSKNCNFYGFTDIIIFMTAVYYILAGLAFALIIWLLNFYVKYKERQESKQMSLKKRREYAAKHGLLVNCPLCSTPLMPGEDLVSRVYRPMNVPDQLCTINGCPACYPNPIEGIKRVCPVCHKEVPLKEGHLVARLFNKSDGKKHVIVTGCTECSKGVK